ncbi:hypothetical protein HH308_06495 [Gordonia sp. TBRC 11910]|uniref:Uncharacterized protein n=1 Tax=Gordonia asplenii TaxID=2725283 RepID=A0A848KXE4_9ACTN|nr:hypothetical protein [Gordonia asplenii]NMO00861.1 hypothetical protein [Gordonia asplenii]
MQVPTIAADDAVEQIPRSQLNGYVVSRSPRLVLPQWLGEWPGLTVVVDWAQSRPAMEQWISRREMDCTAPGETTAWELCVCHRPDHPEEWPHEVWLDGGLSELRQALTATLTGQIEWDAVYGPKLLLNGWACVYGRWEQ